MGSKKLIGLVVLVLVTAASVYIYNEYNRKPADLTDVKPAFNLSATDIVKEFETDEPAANKKYLGKIIQVTGTMASAGYQHDTLVSIILGEGLHNVSCELDKRHFIKTLVQQQEANSITIKGICTGYLMDVEMNRCIIVK